VAVDPRVAVAEVAILFAVLDKLFRDEDAEVIALLKLF
jgi:hypothetical protein